MTISSSMIKASPAQDNPYLTNPLHGTSLKTILDEMVNHYGWEILAAYLNLKCFKTNPSIASSIKFLNKTDWAREKVEAFYLYQYKNLPRASDEQFELPPRERIIPEGDKVGEPAELSLEDAKRLQEIKEQKAKEFSQKQRNNSFKERPYKSSASNKQSANKQSSNKKNSNKPANPWAAYE